MNKGTIFVSIAAFCDPFLRFTIESLFAKANVPKTLAIGVIDQSTEPLSDWLAKQPFADQVRYLHIDPLHSRGVCWARHLAQTLYDDEAFFLQVDSHTWFSAGWDDALREHIDRLTTLSHKPLLTIYPPGFEFDEGGCPVKKFTPTRSVALFTVKPDQILTADNKVLTLKVAYQKPPPEQQCTAQDTCYYGLGFHLAGGFLFTLGQFIHEVPYDPLFYFHGEEQGLALRAFTRGWELFHPQFHRVPLFHLYKMPASANSSVHWRQDLEIRRSIKWTERRTRAQERLNNLLAGRLEPPYALGEERSLKEFTERSGIDYSGLKISPPAVRLIQAPRDY